MSDPQSKPDAITKKTAASSTPKPPKQKERSALTLHDPQGKVRDCPFVPKKGAWRDGITKKEKNYIYEQRRDSMAKIGRCSIPDQEGIEENPWLMHEKNKFEQQCKIWKSKWDQFMAKVEELDLKIPKVKTPTEGTDEDSDEDSDEDLEEDPVKVQQNKDGLQEGFHRARCASGQIW